MNPVGGLWVGGFGETVPPGGFAVQGLSVTTVPVSVVFVNPVG